ncbi:hypothetical protein GCM10009679_63540 [Saccharothrix algeriensis]
MPVYATCQARMCSSATARQSPGVSARTTIPMTGELRKGTRGQQSVKKGTFYYE